MLALPESHSSLHIKSMSQSFLETLSSRLQGLRPFRLSNLL